MSCWTPLSQTFTVRCSRRPTMRILLLPDDVARNDSGSFSARATIRQLRSLGHEVAAIDRSGTMPAIDAGGIRYFAPPTEMRWREHFISPALSAWFKTTCDDFRPDYFVMIGSIQKPAILARAARKRGIKTAFLFYINDFYCHKVYSGLPQGPCIACARSTDLAAIRNGCVPVRRLAHFVKGALIRWALGREIRRADRVLGYGEDQKSIYEIFGVNKRSLAIVGFQFDPSELDAVDVKDRGYFAIAGQPIIQKGVHLIAAVIARLDPAIRVRISILDPLVAQHAISQFGWRDLVAEGRLEVVTGLKSRSDYLAFLAECRGLVLPTYYPTTGEFVLQEALYLGKPVVAFDVGVHKDILRDGDNAMVARVGDVGGLAQRIDMIDKDPHLRQRIAAGARQSSRRYYDLDAIQLWDAALA